MIGVESTQKKNIILLMRSVSRKHGGASSALDIAETLQTLNYDVKILLYSGYLRHILYNKEKTILSHKNIYTLPHFIKTKNLLKSSLKSNIKRFVKNIFYLIDPKRFQFRELLSEANLIIDFISLHERGIRKIRDISQAPIILNHAGSPNGYENFGITNDYFVKPIEDIKDRYKAFCKFYDMILFQSSEQANEYALIDSTYKDRCLVVPPSCQETNVLAASQLNSPYNRNKRIIVCVGSVQPRKAQDQAIEAFNIIQAKYSNLELHFVGDLINPTYYSQLLKIIENHGLKQKIFFHGHRTDYLQFMAHAEIILQTSKSEGVSRILREAMLMRRPIVSYDISGTRELLAAGTEALLVEAQNIQALTNALSQHLDSPIQANVLAENAFQKYAKNNSWIVYASNLKNMIATAIEYKANK